MTGHTPWRVPNGSPSSMPQIVTLTMNPCIDESCSVEHVIPDRKLRCATPRADPGGGGINVARAIRRLGGRALAIYPAGGDTGDLLMRLLDAEGILQLPLPIENSTRRNLNVFEEASGRQFRFVFAGPALTAEEGERCLEALAALHPFPEYVVASGSLPPGVPADFYARAARLTRERGRRFVLDTSGEATTLALDEGVFLVKPSLREFQQETGLADAEERHLLQECRRWIREGRCEVVVLSLGAAGVLCVTARESERLLSPTVPVRSTAGAGDSMLAGIVVLLQQGRPLGEALRYGIAAGAATVMNPGTELCHVPDVERFFVQMLMTPSPVLAAGAEEPGRSGMPDPNGDPDLGPDGVLSS